MDGLPITKRWSEYFDQANSKISSSITGDGSECDYASKGYIK